MTSVGDPDRFAFLDRVLPHMTEEAVTATLDGFTLPLVEGWSMNRLATALRRILSFEASDRGIQTTGPGAATIRDELAKLANMTGKTWLALTDMSAIANHTLSYFAFIRSGVEMAAEESPDYQRYRAALVELEWLSDFLRDAAGGLEIPPPNWRQARLRDKRISRGHLLAPIYEAAFGESITTNNYPSDARHRAPTPFMDFYQRVMALAFNEAATQNIAEVLHAARRAHAKEPWSFAHQLIPDAS